MMRRLRGLLLVCGVAVAILIFCSRIAILVTYREASPFGWKVYKSKYGYSLSYPQHWKVLECIDGFQVWFYDNTDEPFYDACDAPHAIGRVLITGPTAATSSENNLPQFYVDGSPSEMQVRTFAGSYENGVLIKNELHVAVDRSYDGVQYELDQNLVHVSLPQTDPDAWTAVRSFRRSINWDWPSLPL